MLELADIYIIFTYVVVSVARRLGYIGRSGTDGVIRWLICAPLGGETYCSSILIHIGGPALTIQGLPARLPEARARESQIGRGRSLASVHRRKSNFQIRDICGFICKPIYGDMIYGTHAAYD